MKKRYLFLIPFLLLPLLSCNSKQKKENIPTTINVPTENKEIYLRDAYKNIAVANSNFTTRKIDSISDVSYDDFFNLGNKINISIKMEKRELEKLQNDYETYTKSDIYRHCKEVTITMVNYDNTFTWTYDDVGIRQKGNTSRKDIYKNDELCGLNHFKLSFDETFDDDYYFEDAVDWTGKDKQRKTRKNREFLGLTGIDIKWNKNFDETHIKEVYASKVYRALGILTQDIGLSEFNFNIEGGKSYDFGLCTIYEPAKKSMIKRHLKEETLAGFSSWSVEKEGAFGIEGESYGDLYKCTYGKGNGKVDKGACLTLNSVSNNTVGVSDYTGNNLPAYERKTNTDIDYDDARLFNLAKAISNGNYEDIEKLLDIDYFARVEACNYIIGNPDDFRNNNNNYMIYFRRTDGKAVIIPIDNDRCFGIIKDWNPDKKGLKEATVFATKNATGKTPSKLYTKTILSSILNESKALYLNYVKALKNSCWVKEETFNSLYNIAKNTYKDESVESSFDYVGFSLDKIENYTFKEYITSKVAKIDLDYVLISEEDLYKEVVTDSKFIGDIYISGSLNNWNPNLDETYKFKYEGNGVYTLVLNITNSGILEFKFNDGESWDKIDLGSDNGKLAEKGSNFVIENVSKGETYKITINVVKKTVDIAKV